MLRNLDYPPPYALSRGCSLAVPGDMGAAEMRRFARVLCLRSPRSHLIATLGLSERMSGRVRRPRSAAERNDTVANATAEATKTSEMAPPLSGAGTRETRLRH